MCIFFRYQSATCHYIAYICENRQVLLQHIGVNMKKICFVAALCTVLCTACVSRGTAEKIGNERDSLAVALDEKDSLLSEVFAAVNSISENLSAIRMRENLLALDNSESGRRPMERINEDLAAIDNLLAENRLKIESLERSAAELRKAKVQISGLEQMIETLHAQLDEKNRQVEEMKVELTQMGVRVEELATQVIQQERAVEELSAQRTELESHVAETTTQLNTVYYLVGEQKKLIEEQVVRKSGFIGRTLTVDERHTLEHFTKGDARELEEIPVGQKNVTLVTTHPEDSYQWIRGERREVVALRILNPERFWEASKILVISYK